MTEESEAVLLRAALKVLASHGGKARAAKLTPERRQAIAAKAGRASARAAKRRGKGR